MMFSNNAVPRHFPASSHCHTLAQAHLSYVARLVCEAKHVFAHLVMGRVFIWLIRDLCMFMSPIQL